MLKKKAFENDTGVRAHIIDTQEKELRIKTNYTTLENSIYKRYWGQRSSALTVTTNNFIVKYRYREVL